MDSQHKAAIIVAEPTVDECLLDTKQWSSCPGLHLPFRQKRPFFFSLLQKPTFVCDEIEDSVLEHGAVLEAAHQARLDRRPLIRFLVLLGSHERLRVADGARQASAAAHASHLAQSQSWHSGGRHSAPLLRATLYQSMAVLPSTTVDKDVTSQPEMPRFSLSQFEPGTFFTTPPPDTTSSTVFQDTSSSSASSVASAATPAGRAASAKPSAGHDPCRSAFDCTNVVLSRSQYGPHRQGVWASKDRMLALPGVCTIGCGCNTEQHFDLFGKPGPMRALGQRTYKEVARRKAW